MRVFGVAVPSLTTTYLTSSSVDLSSARLGGVCLGFSDAHYGHPRNMIKTDPADNMGDGWETARRLDRPAVLVADHAGILQVPGHEWAVFRLGLRGAPTQVTLDTNHFKGNFPDSALIEATDIDADYPEDKALLVGKPHHWKVLLAPVKLGPSAKHQFSREQLQSTSPISHIRVKMFPDGGISRIRVMGKPAPKI